MRRTAVAALLALALTACSGAPEQAPAAPLSTPPVEPAVVSKGDPHGEQACREIRRANQLHGLDDPQLDILGTVGYAATRSTNSTIAVPGQLLVDAVRLAQAAVGGEDEWRLRLSAATAATQLETACVRGGYYPPPS